MLLTLNGPITTIVVCFSRLPKCLRSIFGKQCGPRSDCSIKAVCSGSTLFASILNSSVMLGSYLQQTTSADGIFRCIFTCALRVNFVNLRFCWNFYFQIYLPCYNNRHQNPPDLVSNLCKYYICFRIFSVHRCPNIDQGFS